MTLTSAQTPSAQVMPGAAGYQCLGVLRFSGIQLLISLWLLIVLFPCVEHVRYGDLIEASLLTVVLLSAVLAVGGHARTLAIAVVLVAPAVVMKWVSHWHPALFLASLVPAFAMVFVTFVMVHLLHFVLRSPRVDLEVLCAAVSGYLLMGMIWSSAYTLVARLDPGSFACTIAPAANRRLEGFDALYFSLITLNTVGYGDIVPVSAFARMLTMLESTSGVFYVAVLIARLVPLYSFRNAADASNRNQV